MASPQEIGNAYAAKYEAYVNGPLQEKISAMSNFHPKKHIAQHMLNGLKKPEIVNQVGQITKEMYAQNPALINAKPEVVVSQFLGRDDVQAMLGRSASLKEVKETLEGVVKQVHHDMGEQSKGAHKTTAVSSPHDAIALDDKGQLMPPNTIPTVRGARQLSVV